MVNNKRMTDLCIMCNHENCKTCSLNPEYTNQYSPNEQTAAMLSDLIIPDNVIDEITWQTMETRCRRA